MQNPIQTTPLNIRKKSMPSHHIIKIYCIQCRALLYKYQKEGSGHLVKCFKERIVKDFTKGDLSCPHCKVPFARESMIRGKPANKIIQGKVFIKK
jgi:hypothetical protein